MILVFIFIFISLVISVLLLSSVKVDVDRLVIDNEKLSINKNSKITEDGNFIKKLEFIKEIHIYFQLYFLNKIKIVQIEMDKDKLMNLPISKIREKVEKIDVKELKNDEWEKREIKKAIKALKLNLEKLKLNMSIGTEDVLLTTAVVTIISTGIALVLPHIIKKYKDGRYYYKVTPIYMNQNKIKLDFKCIICTKLVHIIYVIYILIKMRRVKKNERTSNRRSYDYSYE